MSIREVPKSYEYECDWCSDVHKQGYAAGHYTNSTPPLWVTLRVTIGGKAPVDVLLCPKCWDNFREKDGLMARIAL